MVIVDADIAIDRPIAIAYCYSYQSDRCVMGLLYNMCQYIGIFSYREQWPSPHALTDM